MGFLGKASRGWNWPPKVEKNAFASGGMLMGGGAMGGNCGVVTAMSGRDISVIGGIKIFGGKAMMTVK